MKVNVTYFGMNGEGSTMKEAKADAASKVEAALNADYTPTVLVWRGNVAIIWRTPSGIRSAHCAPNGHLGGICHHGNGWSMDSVIDSLKYSLATTAADIDSDEVPSILVNGQVRSFLTWLGFQRAYRHARSAGMPEVDCHRWACENESKFSPANNV